MSPQALAIGAVVVLTCGLAAAGAEQGPAAGSPLGSVSELTNEVRLLRQAVEKASQTQSQVQAMAVYLSAQQNRLVQSSARADAIRRELDELSRQETEIPRQLRELETTLASGVMNSTPQGRADLEERMKALRGDMARLSTMQSRIAAQLAEADSAVSADLARWTEMITRLEQLTRP
jgi:chromosome segregation ATPase